MAWFGDKLSWVGLFMIISEGLFGYSLLSSLFLIRKFRTAIHQLHILFNWAKYNFNRWSILMVNVLLVPNFVLLIFAGAVVEAFVRLHEKGLIYQGMDYLFLTFLDKYFNFFSVIKDKDVAIFSEWAWLDHHCPVTLAIRRIKLSHHHKPHALQRNKMLIKMSV